MLKIPLKLPLSKRTVSGILGINAMVAWVQHIAFFRLPQKSCLEKLRVQI